MLTIYRRHLKNCEHRDKGRAHRRCKCPIWADGYIGRREIRQSMKMRDWTRAQDMIRQWESEGAITIKAEPVTIAAARDAFVSDARARQLQDATLLKYRVLFAQLEAFAANRGLRFIREMDLTAVRDFRASWPDANLSALKKLERLRAFLRFCVESGWITDNAASKLKNPKITQAPTLPMTHDEIAKILAACNDYPDRANAVRLRAFVLMLRYSGLRIRDVVTLSVDRVNDGKLFLYTAKTGTPVWCPIPAPVSEALAAIPTPSKFYFWTGESNPKSAVGDWQRSLRRLFKLAGVPDAHAHRFRDTFAVGLLMAGVPIERVSILLGHQSIRVTEKHYSPWIRARQEQLEADVRRTWDTDVVVLAETRGTPEVHRKSARPN